MRARTPTACDRPLAVEVVGRNVLVTTPNGSQRFITPDEAQAIAKRIFEAVAAIRARH